MFKMFKSRVLSLQEKETLIKGLRVQRSTYLSDDRLMSILETCESIEGEKLKGCFIEAGCALGGSTIAISKAKRRQRSLKVYDVFEMIPAPSEADTPDVHERYKTIVEGKSHGIQGDIYYGYRSDLYSKVISNLGEFGLYPEQQNITLIKGLVQQSLAVDEPVAFAHIDVDWYEPVKTCLERIFPHLINTGSIILDDYFDWGGCQKATDDFLNTVPNKFLLDDSRGSLKIIKKV